jgi:hypothetical protein
MYITLDGIVSDYILRYRTHARAEMRFFAGQRSSSAAIGKAALCTLPNGKRHPHQWRIPGVVLEQAEARLQTAGTRLAAASDFAALHKIVEREIGGIRGIGALTVYDIAHRIGAYFRRTPQRIYLHAGTREGAAFFGLRGESIDPKQLPYAFSRLAAAEIEDCLCIYKAELRYAQKARAPSTSTQSRKALAAICPESSKSDRFRVSSGCKCRM